MVVLWLARTGKSHSPPILLSGGNQAQLRKISIMARNRTRRANGCAWYRKLDDSWYANVDSKRVRRRDVIGQPIRGKDHRRQAELAMARLKLQLSESTAQGTVLVATVADA